MNVESVNPANCQVGIALCWLLGLIPAAPMWIYNNDSRLGPTMSLSKLYICSVFRLEVWVSVNNKIYEIVCPWEMKQFVQLPQYNCEWFIMICQIYGIVKFFLWLRKTIFMTPAFYYIEYRDSRLTLTLWILTWDISLFDAVFWAMTFTVVSPTTMWVWQWLLSVKQTCGSKCCMFVC